MAPDAAISGGVAVRLERVKRGSSSFRTEDHDGVATQPSAVEEVFLSTIAIGMGLTKSVLSAFEVDGAGHVLRRLDHMRDASVVWLAQLPVGTVVAMEA